MSYPHSFRLLAIWLFQPRPSLKDNMPSNPPKTLQYPTSKTTSLYRAIYVYIKEIYNNASVSYSNPLKPVEVYWNSLKPPGFPWILLKSTEFHWNPLNFTELRLKSTEINWNPVKCTQPTLRLKPTEIGWNPVKCTQATLSGYRWHILGRSCCSRLANVVPPSLAPCPKSLTGRF